MKNNTFLYCTLALTAIAGAVATIFGFWRNILILEIFGIAGLVIAFLGTVTFVPQIKLNSECDRLFGEKKFEEERAFLEKKMKNPFYLLSRIHILTHYIRVCMILDDLATASRYIDRLRHGGGVAWKYKTAYCFILIKLDEGDLKTARRDYESFRTHCSHADVYKTQIEILTAIFSRLLSIKNATPLPEAAVESHFPVVGRILGRNYEEQAEAGE